MRKPFLAAALFFALSIFGQDCVPLTGVQESPCPLPPEGYCPYGEKLASPSGLTAAPFKWYYPPTPDGGEITTALRFEFAATPGKTYEVQYTRDLLSGVWFAYANFVMPADYPQAVTVDVPIYTCDSRFYRLMSDDGQTATGHLHVDTNGQ